MFRRRLSGRSSGLTSGGERECVLCFANEVEYSAEMRRSGEVRGRILRSRLRKSNSPPSRKNREKGGAPRSFGIPTLKNVSLLVAGRFVHGAALHYEIYVLEGADVGQGIGLNSDDVGVFTGLERTNVGGASY